MKIQYWDKSESAPIRTISADRNIKVAEFKDCIVEGLSTNYPQPLLHTDGELLLPTIEKFMSLGRGTVYEKTMEYEISGKRLWNVRSIATPVFYFVYNCANYFHWLYDTVPYLYSYFDLKKQIPNLKLLISPPEGKDDLYPFVYETLELLGITKDDLVFLRDDVCYFRMFVGSSLTHNRMSLEPPHPGLYEIIDSMEGRDSNVKKVYVSRRTWTKEKNENIGTDYTQERKCVNEDEVVEFFIKNGFEEVFAEDLSMKDKIGLFRNADFVAGPIGGGMSNALFCKPECKVLSINSPEFFTVNKRLEFAMNRTNLFHFDDTKFVERRDEIETHDNALSISGGINSNWKVDMNKLKTFFEEIQ